MTPLLNLLPCQLGDTRLRRFEAGDLARFQAYRSDPGLARFQAWSPMTERAAREFIEEMSDVAELRQGEWIQLAIVNAESNRIIGDVGMHLAADGREAEVGFTLRYEAQGQGHATEAVRMATRLFFKCSQARVVRGVTDARNVASIRVLERTGFEKVCEQQSAFKGEQCTEFVYVCQRVDA